MDCHGKVHGFPWNDNGRLYELQRPSSRCHGSSTDPPRSSMEAVWRPMEAHEGSTEPLYKQRFMDVFMDSLTEAHQSSDCMIMKTTIIVMTTIVEAHETFHGPLSSSCL